VATATTPEQVAAWMLAEVQRTDYLYQETVVYDIASRFGDAFTYINQNGNLAIDKKVLAAFKKLSGEAIIWERGQRLWRKRQEYDEPGRRQY
jgi:hypothetical protein